MALSLDTFGAMSNTHNIVIEVAHWIAPSNDEHGVHVALQRYGLCDREEIAVATRPQGIDFREFYELEA